jgi:hypothetical protein
MAERLSPGIEQDIADENAAPLGGAPLGDGHHDERGLLSDAKPFDQRSAERDWMHGNAEVGAADVAALE